jgi:hypothetical protein
VRSVALTLRPPWIIGVGDSGGHALFFRMEMENLRRIEGTPGPTRHENR